MERFEGHLATQEKHKQTFDVLASVRMAHYDIEHFGEVLPETEQRIEDEELSYIVEGMEEAACSSFDLQRDEEGKLVYFDKGKWRSYVEMLEEAVEVHRTEALQDSRKWFLVERAYDDLRYGQAMQTLSPGESLQWDAPYCHEEAQLFGEEFVKSLGFVPSRKMGFIYDAKCRIDGSVRLLSQTVDQSDMDAFNASRVVAGVGDIQARVRAYDEVLYEKYGKKFYTGREVTDENPEPENAWQKLLKEKDLISHHVNKIKWLARQAIHMTELELSVEKKRLTYGVWAELKQRFDGVSLSYAELAQTVYASTTPHEAALQQERYISQVTATALRRFVAAGKTLTGCGGSITIESESDLLFADTESVRDSIFSKDKNQDGDCEFISKKCPECGAKNVKTRVTKTRITGSCGCSKSKQ